MVRKIFGFCLAVVLVAATYGSLQAATPDANGYYADALPISIEPISADVTPGYCEETQTLYRERLLEMGWEDEWLDMFVEMGISLQNMYNQARFMNAVDALMMGYPVGDSGEVIAPQYMGPIRFDDMGILNVAVLEGAFYDPASATAIYELLEMGMIVYVVAFSQQEITATFDKLHGVWELARVAGVSSWGQGAENGIIVSLDPYTPEQKEIFTAFLLEHDINPDIMLFRPAVTEEMRMFRANAVTQATQQPGDKIVPVGEVEVSRTGIAFSLENTTDEMFTYGAPWDLAFYYDGDWLPVPHLPGSGGGAWTMQAYMLQGGGIQQYRIGFGWHFGELAPGRYMFIRNGWLGEWSMDNGGVYILVEFEVTEDTMEYLPPMPEQEWISFINVVSHSDVTAYGMRVVVENTSEFDIDHRAQMIFIVPAAYAATGERWEWWNYHLPLLPMDEIDWDYLMQGEGLIPAGGTLEFEITWAPLFGELPPGDFKIDLSLGGRAHPPHPTGWAFGDGLIAFTVEG
jgi:hypothetical protein